VKLLVFGHSDSDGSRFPDRSLGWPWIVQRTLRESRGVELEVVHKLLFAGPTALAHMERQLEDQHPDIVVVASSGYSVQVRLASNRVRQRFGVRAGDWVNRAERRTARLSAQLGPGRANRALTLGRRAARALLGTAPAFTFEQLTACYDDILDSLARHEEIHTIVFGGLGYGPVLQRLNPRLNELQDALHQALYARVLEHRFDWLIHEDLLGGREAKVAFMQRDGVHSNEAAQQIAADAVLALIAARL
jgi:hypothetical protein